MGWLADWLWCSASKNRLRALFLILSQSLCFSQNYWCMSGLEKQRGNIKSAFEVQGFLFFFVEPQLNVSTRTLIGIQPSSEGDGQSLWASVQMIFWSIEWARHMLCFLPSETYWLHTFLTDAERAVLVSVILIHNQSKSISGVEDMSNSINIQPEHTHPHSHPPPFLSHTPPTCMYVALYSPSPLLLEFVCTYLYV